MSSPVAPAQASLALLIGKCDILQVPTLSDINDNDRLRRLDYDIVLDPLPLGEMYGHGRGANP